MEEISLTLLIWHEGLFEKVRDVYVIFLVDKHIVREGKIELKTYPDLT